MILQYNLLHFLHCLGGREGDTDSNDVQWWFQELLRNRNLDCLWKSHFRITRNTFDELSWLLGDQIRKNNANMRDAVPVETRVAVGLWRLANGDGYRNTGLQFGIGKSTAQTICVEFERALGQLKDEFLKI